MIASIEKLTCLSIFAPTHRIATSFRIWHCLSQLTLLQSLALNFHHVDEWMFEPVSFELPLSSFSFAGNAPIAYEEPTTPKLRPLATAFPHLESLHLATRSATLLLNEHLKSLPPTLTSITLDGFGKIDDTCIQYTTAASVSIETYNKELTGTLPSTLTSLSFSTGYKSEIQESFWNKSNLVSLRVSMPPNFVACLPPTLEKLELDTVAPVLSFKHLPRLKVLEVTILGAAQFTDTNDPGFPPTLEELTFFRPREPFLLRPEIMPPNLKKLNVGFPIRANLSELMAILSCLNQLTKLKIRCSTEIGLTHLSNLPPLLKTLKWTHNWKNACLYIDEILPKLPQHLEKLVFEHSSVTISSASFGLLPRKLRLMTLRVGIDEQVDLAKCVKELPRTLKFMDIQYVIPFASEGAIVIL